MNIFLNWFNEHENISSWEAIVFSRGKETYESVLILA